MEKLRDIQNATFEVDINNYYACYSTFLRWGGGLVEWGTLDWGPDVLAVKTGRGLKMALSFSISNLVRI